MRGMLMRQQSLWRWLVALASLLAPLPAVAHTDASFAVDVDHALLEPAKTGNTAIVKLRIHNNMTQPIRLLAVETPVAEGSRMMIAAGAGRALPLDSLSVLPDESLNFATSHMWIELFGLKRSLTAGMHVPLRLLFGPDHWVDVVADVGAHHDH